MCCGSVGDILGPEPEYGAGGVPSLDRVDEGEEVGLVEIGNQLVAGDSRLDQFNIAGEGDVAEFIYDMDAETVIGQEQIADTEDQNISGRRFSASPHFIDRIHKVHISSG
jgi:hypothetical protein